MTFDPLSPEVVYATKGTIKFSGTQAQATAAAIAGQARLSGAVIPVTATVAGGTIKLAT